MARSTRSLTRERGVPDATRKEILAQTRALRVLLPRAARAGLPTEPADERPLDVDGPVSHGIEPLCRTLLPARTGRNGREHDVMSVLLGQAPAEAGDGYLRWPTQGETAKATGCNQPQVSVSLRKYASRWLANQALDQVRDEIIALLDTRGAVMSATELAEALIAARGSYSAEPRRTTQAIGLVRAAVEAELPRGGDANRPSRSSPPPPDCR